MTITYSSARGGSRACTIVACLCFATAGVCVAQTAKKPSAGKGSSITIASPEDEAKAVKKMALLENAGPKMEAAKAQAERFAKLLEGVTTTYAKAESPVREAADKLIAAYREAKVLNEELADGYKNSNASKVESMLEKITASNRSVTLLQGAPDVRKQQVADLLEETATKLKPSYTAVSEVFDKWAESRKAAGAAARNLADLLLTPDVTDAKVDAARDAHLLAQNEKNALNTYLNNMNAIRQKQAAGGAPERVAELAQAEQMANDLLAATRGYMVEHVKFLKLGRQVDESLVEANLAVRDAATPPVRPPAARTTGVKPETIDLSGKQKTPAKKPGH
jgi:hypothetical protein